jgi:hypothetical protein
MPLRHIREGKKIEEIIGIDWKQGGEQLGCILSGNYRDTEGRNTIKKEDVENYLNIFALPVAEGIIRGYLEGSIPDHGKIAQKQMLEIKKRIQVSGF